MKSFHALGLPEALMQSLERMQFITPTPIQAAAIPPALQGKDVLGSAQTGTGKTAAFGIPLLTHLMSNGQASALILTPTRELAIQIMQVMHALLGLKRSMEIALLIGGDPIHKQLRQLRMQPRIIVGTPGRINDHLRSGRVQFHNTHFLVLDEIDRMLDMGFTDQVDDIVRHLPKKRQTLLFSATLPKKIAALAAQYLDDPVRISIGSTSQPTSHIKQQAIHLSEAEKYSELLKQLQDREGSVLVFMKTKWSAEKMAKRLRAEDQRAEAIHGNLRQNRRERVINAFRNRRNRIMVATDIAARGLDIPHIAHVINYDLPQCPEDYIHRIGRTGRAGAEGEALCFITPADAKRWRAIQSLMNPHTKSADKSCSPTKAPLRHKKSRSDTVRTKRPKHKHRARKRPIFA